MLMTLDVLNAKLKALNPLLYVDTNHRTFSSHPAGSSGIYLRKVRGATEEDIKLGLAEHAEADTLVGWTIHDSIPEGDLFDEKGRLKGLGWRTIVHRLVKQGLTSKSKAARVFGWYKSDYDMMSYDERVTFQRKNKDE